jgi:hypothetical protein
MNGEPRRAFTGSITSRSLIRATWPLARLTVGPDGITISPSWGGLLRLWRLFRLPLGRWEWSEVETAALGRSVLGSRPRGVRLRVAGKSFDFGYIAPTEVLEEIRRFEPRKISEQPVRVFP